MFEFSSFVGVKFIDIANFWFLKGANESNNVVSGVFNTGNKVVTDVIDMRTNFGYS